MTRLEELQQLYDFHRWANRTLLEVVRGLTEEQFARELGGSFGSIQATLVHVLAAEWVWLQRWHGSSPRGMPETWKRASLGELLRAWGEVEAAQAAFVAALPEARLDEVVDYRTTDGDPKRNSYAHMFRHVVNHGTYHRGQVVGKLRQLGLSAPSTDLILFYRTLEPQPQATTPRA